jgi:hypothetical protein
MAMFNADSGIEQVYHSSAFLCQLDNSQGRFLQANEGIVGEPGA